VAYGEATHETLCRWSARSPFSTGLGQAMAQYTPSATRGQILELLAKLQHRLARTSLRASSTEDFGKAAAVIANNNCVANIDPSASRCTKATVRLLSFTIDTSVCSCENSPRFPNANDNNDGCRK